MGIIPEQDQATIRKFFEENLTGNVEIVMFTEAESRIVMPGKQPCETCAQTEELLEEVSSLSDKITLTVHDIATAKEEAARHAIEAVPAFTVSGAARGRVRFFGIPSGYEFSGFIGDLADVSKGATALSDETREFLAGLTEDLNVKVFTTPS